MSHGHGLVNQSLIVDTVALGTLAARAALIINTQFSAPTNSFLLKRGRYFLQLTGRSTADDGPILVGMAHGDANVSEIASAMVERNVNGPDDITSMLDQDSAWAVYQNSLKPFIIRGDQTYAQVEISDWFQPGGQKGIPLIEGSGMVLFVFNSGSGALTTGATVNGLTMVQGVWLRD